MTRKLQLIEHPLEAALNDVSAAFADLRSTLKKSGDPAKRENLDRDHAARMRAFDRLDAAQERVRSELLNFITSQFTAGHS